MIRFFGFISFQAAAVGPSLPEQRPAGVWAAGQTEQADAGEKRSAWGGAEPTCGGTEEFVTHC